MKLMEVDKSNLCLQSCHLPHGCRSLLSCSLAVSIHAAMCTCVGLQWSDIPFLGHRREPCWSWYHDRVQTLPFPYGLTTYNVTLKMIITNNLLWLNTCMTYTCNTQMFQQTTQMSISFLYILRRGCYFTWSIYPWAWGALTLTPNNACWTDMVPLPSSRRYPNQSSQDQQNHVFH